jgi:phosphohistidine phosphatase
VRVLRRIAVVRHAKSDWAAGTADHDRPLNDRGRREAPELARKLRAMGWAPRIVLSSDAARTRETWACMAPELPEPARLEHFESLYHAGRGEAVAALATVADDAASDDGRGVVLLLGHNPGWEDMVSAVSDTPTEMKTATAALLESTAPSYREALSGAMKLVALISPR